MGRRRGCGRGTMDGGGSLFFTSTAVLLTWQAALRMHICAARQAYVKLTEGGAYVKLNPITSAQDPYAATVVQAQTRTRSVRYQNLQFCDRCCAMAMGSSARNTNERVSRQGQRPHEE